MKASIIVPSYNAKERLHYNLLSLNQQDYPFDDFEVIVIDNGSTDNTLELLKTFKANYSLIPVRIEQNRGIAYGRNQGIVNATGDILIFHDSDMIAAKDYVRKHIEAHQDDHSVICGLFWKRIYSFYYPNFEPFHIEKFKTHAHKYPNKQLSNTEKTTLITKGQIINGSFMDYAFDLDLHLIHSLKEIINRHGESLSGYHSPWRFFYTNNASVLRKNVLDIGTFDDRIVKYGYEDYDLAIRLHQSGHQFKLRTDIVSVHQEHPTNLTSLNDSIENINYLCQKYNDIRSLDIQLIFSGRFSQDETNAIMGDILKLRHSNEYDDLLSVFLQLLHLERKRNFGNKIELSNEVLNWPEIQQKLSALRQKFGMRDFIEAFQRLVKRIYQMDILTEDVIT
ncbi:glycosyltransferase family 2 protein [Fictibacillus sp. Mic-4]|uniref:glycosyltransferase n=1 Tax=Fictibacillus sp. Mic-4 TaxID=3132826 RepID=UPI003CEBBB53